LNNHPQDAHTHTTVPRKPLSTSRRLSVAAFAALAVLFCSGATSSPTGCQSSGSIGPSNAEVAGAAVGIGAVIAVAIIVPVKISHSHHILKGCVFAGPDGIKLQTSDNKTYTLEGDAANIKAGDMIKFHGSKVKKTKDSAGDQVFRVQKLTRDYGPCHATQMAATNPAE
jgi:hypothetical protein